VSSFVPAPAAADQALSMKVGCTHLTVQHTATLAQREADMTQLVRYINVHITHLRKQLGQAGLSDGGGT
jgi:hypothetical protein